MAKSAGVAKKSKSTYRTYLKSAVWQSKRAQVLFRDGGQCTGMVDGRRCCVRWNLEVHHLTYERFGRERLSDLQTLCEACHQAAHAAQKSLIDAGRPIGRENRLPANPRETTRPPSTRA
jgi:5-methylcytosine-specific restriction endonuclease McrA